jgi:PAS domain S-box-containing protein
MVMNQERKFVPGNPAAFKMFGCVDNEELSSLTLMDISPEYQPDGTPTSLKAEELIKIALKKGSHFFEWKHKRKNGKEFFTTVSLVKVEFEKKIILQGVIRDITENKLTEESLKKREIDLEIKTRNLEEANTALRVLLKKRDEDRKNLEEGVLFNVRRVIDPYLEKLKNSILDERQKLYLSILEQNLNDIISPFSKALSSKYLKLTPKELEVARLVQQGKTTKEIATVLGITQKTAEIHRENIRKKFNLNNKKENLRTHLLSSS